jgi:hypothetical protein
MDASAANSRGRPTMRFLCPKISMLSPPSQSLLCWLVSAPRVLTCFFDEASGEIASASTRSAPVSSPSHPSCSSSAACSRFRTNRREEMYNARKHDRTDMAELKFWLFIDRYRWISIDCFIVVMPFKSSYVCFM